MTVRELIATLGLKVVPDGFAAADRAIEAVNKKVGGVFEGLGKVEKAFLGLGAVAAAVKLGGGIKGVLDEVNELTSRLSKTAPQLGLSVQELQGWEHAANLSGVSADQFASAAKTLGSQIRHLGLGSKEAGIALQGIKLGGENGKKLDLLLEQIADKFQKMPDGIQKTAKAQALFGESGAALIPFLNKGSAGLREYRSEVAAFGAQLSEGDLKAASEYRLEMKRLGLIWSGLKQAVAGPLMETISGVTKQFNAWVKAQKGDPTRGVREGFQQSAKFGGVLLRIMQGLFTAGTFAVKWWDALAVGVTAVAVALNWAAVSAVLFGSYSVVAGLRTLAVWALVFGKFLLIAALIALAVLILEDFIGYLRGAESITGKLGEKIQELFKEWSKPDAGDGWFMRGLRKILAFWGEEGLKKGVREFVTEAKNLLDGLAAWFEERWAPIRKFFGKVADVAGSIKEGVVSAGSRVSRAVGGAREAIGEFVVPGSRGFDRPLERADLTQANLRPAPAGGNAASALFRPVFNISGTQDPDAVAQAVARKMRELKDQLASELE